ncbi:MAG: DUF6064 family protein [Alphaproteobacteria bacterium]|nr:DUF6064 family protein [Alphaproteobacteria bacterium]MCY4317720.1 DUF6064 family protein [Alphaproteobacteria bacterium]
MDRFWALEDMLPFEPRVYWRLFQFGNELAWPAQPLLLAVGAALFAGLLRGWRPDGRWLGPTLGAVWLWTGWQFVALGYGAVNWAAPWFAWGFYAEATLLAALGLTGRLVFSRQAPGAHAGLSLLAAALFAWPLLAGLDGRGWREAEIAAIAPDPTAIATLGLVALALRSRWTVLLCIPPVLWLSLSTLTLLTMGAWQGWAVLAALTTGLTALQLRPRSL